MMQIIRQTKAESSAMGVLLKEGDICAKCNVDIMKPAPQYTQDGFYLGCPSCKFLFWSSKKPSSQDGTVTGNRKDYASVSQWQNIMPFSPTGNSQQQPSANIHQQRMQETQEMLYGQNIEVKRDLSLRGTSYPDNTYRKSRIELPTDHYMSRNLDSINSGEASEYANGSAVRPGFRPVSAPPIPAQIADKN